MNPTDTQTVLKHNFKEFSAATEHTSRGTMKVLHLLSNQTLGVTKCTISQFQQETGLNSFLVRETGNGGTPTPLRPSP